ncbi:MAG: hypothetical protein ACKPKO_53580 [Candidatus Fonsibacter sp.]
MYSIFILEEIAETHTAKEQHILARTNGNTQSAALGYGSATRRGITDRRSTKTLTT